MSSEHVTAVDSKFQPGRMYIQIVGAGGFAEFRATHLVSRRDHRTGRKHIELKGQYRLSTDDGWIDLDWWFRAQSGSSEIVRIGGITFLDSLSTY